MAFNNAINSTIGTSQTGATNTLTVTNPSNTASSQAQVNVTVGGTSAGDAFTTYTIAGTTNWSEGIDNSASDAFVIAASTALGTTNVMSMATGGAVSVVLGDLDVTRSSSGGNVISTISNTSNTASSTARQQVTVAGTSAGDAFTTYTVTGTTNWSIGTDNSVTGDPFVISGSAALGTTNIMSALTTGEINYPLLPAFSAYLGTTDSNVTGDASTYNLGSGNALTEIFDQGSDFVTTGTFTAPVTGRYFFQGTFYFSGILSTHTNGFCQVVTSNRNYSDFTCSPADSDNSSGAMQMISACFADMDAADTAVFQLQVINGTKVIDVIGGGSPDNRFSGRLVC